MKTPPVGVEEYPTSLETKKWIAEFEQTQSLGFTRRSRATERKYHPLG